MTFAIYVTQSPDCMRDVAYNRNAKGTYTLTYRINILPGNTCKVIHVFLQCCEAAGKILTDTSRRAVRKLQQSFLYF